MTVQNHNSLRPGHPRHAGLYLMELRQRFAEAHSRRHLLDRGGSRAVRASEYEFRSRHGVPETPER